MAIPLFPEEGLHPEEEDILMQDGRRIYVIGGPWVQAIGNGDEWVEIPRVNHEGVPLDDDENDDIDEEEPEQFRVIPWRADVPLWSVQTEARDEPAVQESDDESTVQESTVQSPTVPEPTVQPSTSSTAQASTPPAADSGVATRSGECRRRTRYSEVYQRTEQERSAVRSAAAPTSTAPVASAATDAESGAAVPAAAAAAAVRPRRARQPPTAVQPKKCFNCGSTEHLRVDCNCRDNRLCGYCWQLGHINRMCPSALSGEHRPTAEQREVLQQQAEREIRRRISWGLATEDDLKQLANPERVPQRK